ncbi:MAG: hypothetical protein O7E49_01500 [Gemmatimonadetes bacterium]|nr:hypothetical protein [Gemmatimonadota bacterium]
MFVGHYGVALALKKADPRLSLGTLFLAAQFVDILWGIFLILGWEQVRVDPGYTAVTPFQFLSYPLSHSLVAGVLWAIVVGAAYYSRPTIDSSHRRRGAIVLGVAVLSHWLLDALVHLPDLPLAGSDSLKVGLGLWDSIGATYALEYGLLAVGVWIYVGTKTKRHPLRTARLAILIGLLLAFSVVNLWAPPPNNMTLIGASAIVMYLGIAWLGSWVDRDPPHEPDSETHRHKRKSKAAR